MAHDVYSFFYFNFYYVVNSSVCHFNIFPFYVCCYGPSCLKWNCCIGTCIYGVCMCERVCTHTCIYIHTESIILAFPVPWSNWKVRRNPCRNSWTQVRCATRHSCRSLAVWQLLQDLYLQNWAIRPSKDPSSSSWSSSRREPLRRSSTMTIRTLYGMPPEFHWWGVRVPLNLIDPSTTSNSSISTVQSSVCMDVCSNLSASYEVYWRFDYRLTYRLINIINNKCKLFKD